MQGLEFAVLDQMIITMNGKLFLKQPGNVGVARN